MKTRCTYCWRKARRVFEHASGDKEKVCRGHYHDLERGTEEIEVEIWWASA